MLTNIIEFYNHYDEDSRLDRDNYHRTEFLVTLKLLESYLAPGSRILDAGAGTGRYSCYYAELGHSVVGLDLTPRHVESIRNKAAQPHLEDRLSAVLGDARDLSMFQDESFDAVFCMGPLYHLKDDASRTACMDECLRVLKKGGLLAVAYVNRAGAYLYEISRNPSVLTEQPPAHVLSANGGLNNDCFVTLSPQEIEKFMDQFPIILKEHAATEGVSAIMCELVNKMSAEQFEAWLEFMLLTNRKSDNLGTSIHNLFIAQKKNNI